MSSARRGAIGQIVTESKRSTAHPRRSRVVEVDLVLNAAGPFLHTAAPLAAACLDAGVHYIDVGNELQVFRTLYDLDQRARRAGVAVIPGTGFGVVATNCLARYVSDAVGGARSL